MTEDLGGNSRSTSLRSPEPVPVSALPGNDQGRKLSAITERQAGFIEGYAAACEDVQRQLTGDSFSAKSYDPMTVELERAVMHSYAFNLKDGGRHHPLYDYESVGEICALLAAETVEHIRQEQSA